jgi:hypothetical protein
MFPSNMEFLGRERDRERFQEAEHLRLVKLARPQLFNYQATARKLTAWLGGQMVELGCKLQGCGTALLSKAAPVDAAQVQVR